MWRWIYGGGYMEVDMWRWICGGGGIEIYCK